MISIFRHIRTVTAAAAITGSAALSYALPSQQAVGDTVILEELVITARRPMQDIGLQKTTFDSIALKENIAE